MGPHDSAPEAGTGPDFDHLPVVGQLENGLQEWLNRPVQDILNQFNLGQLPTGGPDGAFPTLPGAQLAGAPGAPGAGGMGGNFASGLLKPITDMLGTLGPGIFQGLNPSEMFGGVSQAFQSAASGLQQALSSMTQGMGEGWSGAGAGAAAAKTGETLANGASVAAQGTALGGQFSTAAANVAQGQARLVEILTQCQDELSALAAGLPWTAPNMVESASRASALATECITELESTLTSQAAATTATGAPVAVAQGPEMAMGMLGPMLSVGMSMVSPALSLGTMPLTMGVQALTTGMQAGLQAGTGLISSVGQAGAGNAAAPAAGAGRLVSATHPSGAAGGGGGPVATTPARATPSSPMVQNETNSTATARSVVARPSAGIGGMSGAGMMGAAGAGGQSGKAGANNGSHTSASFLHTTDQGGQLVGDLGHASPAVIGDNTIDSGGSPDSSPDIRLRI